MGEKRGRRRDEEVPLNERIQEMKRPEKKKMKKKSIRQKWKCKVKRKNLLLSSCNFKFPQTQAFCNAFSGKFKQQINPRNQAAHSLSNKNISSHFERRGSALHANISSLSLFFLHFIHFSLRSLIEYNLIHSLTAFFHIIRVSFICSSLCFAHWIETKNQKPKTKMAVYFSHSFRLQQEK